MTVPIVAPGSPEANARRRRRLLLSGGVVSVLLILGLGLWQVATASGGLSCGNAQKIAAEKLQEAANPTKETFTPGPKGAEKKKAYVEDQKKRAADAVGYYARNCTDAGTPTTTPPSVDACKGVTFSPYAVADTNRFGNPPVDLANPGSPQDVANAFVKQFKTNRWLSAAWSQRTYLVKDGISTEEVQAKAQSFVTDPEAWRATNNQLRGIMSRASFELKRSSEPYATQEAVVNGTNQCIAPAARDVGTKARGMRLLFIIHRAPEDGGGTIILVVDCNGQIWIVHTAPPSEGTTQTTQQRTTQTTITRTTEAPPPPPVPTTTEAPPPPPPPPTVYCIAGPNAGQPAPGNNLENCPKSTVGTGQGSVTVPPSP